MINTDPLETLNLLAAAPICRLGLCAWVWLMQPLRRAGRLPMLLLAWLGRFCGLPWFKLWPGASKALLGRESKVVPSTWLSTGAKRVAVSILVGAGCVHRGQMCMGQKFLLPARPHCLLSSLSIAEAHPCVAVGLSMVGRRRKAFLGLAPWCCFAAPCCFGSLWHCLNKRQGRVGGFAFWTARLESKGCIGDAARGCKRFGRGAFEE